MSLFQLDQHPYYCNGCNYHASDMSQVYGSWADFYEAMGDADEDYNLVFRWDYRVDEDTEEAYLEVFVIQQRKGKFVPIRINGIKPEDEPLFRAWITPRWHHLEKVWAPLSKVDRPTIYVAGPSEDLILVREAMLNARTIGFHVIFDWTKNIDRDGNDASRKAHVTDDDLLRTAQEDARWVLSADLVWYVCSDKKSEGAATELGLALAARKGAVIVSPSEEGRLPLFGRMAEAVVRREDFASYWRSKLFSYPKHEEIAKKLRALGGASCE